MCVCVCVCISTEECLTLEDLLIRACGVYRLHIYRGVRLPPNEISGYDTKLYRCDDLALKLGNMEYTFISITFTSDQEW